MDESILEILEGFVFLALIATIIWFAGARVWRRPPARPFSRTCVIVSTSSLLTGGEGNPSRVGALIELELERARRFDYAVSVVVIQLDKLQAEHAELKKALAAIADNDGTATLPHAPPGTVHIFRDRPEMTINLRATDVAIYDEEKNRFVMLLVGSKKKDALRIADRVRQQLISSFGGRISFGCAEFPVEDYFVGDLILRAERELVAGDSSVSNTTLKSGESI